MTLEVESPEGYIWSGEDYGGCGLHTAQRLETSLLSAVSVVPTAIKDVNEKGRLADAAWLRPYFLSFTASKGWMVLHDRIGSTAFLQCSL